MTSNRDPARGPLGGLTPYLLMMMAKGGAYPSQVAIASALSVTPGMISWLKQRGVREGVFREDQWEGWMAYGQFTADAREYYREVGPIAGIRVAP